MFNIIVKKIECNINTYKIFETLLGIEVEVVTVK